MRATLPGLALAALLSACAAQPQHFADPPQPMNRTIYVLEKEWHTEIALPTTDVTGGLTRFKSIFPEANYIAFGFAARNYAQKPHTDFLDKIEAILPGAGLMMITELAGPPPAMLPNDTMVAIPVTQAELDRLADYVWDSMEKSPSDQLNKIGDGPFPGYFFYGASTRYTGLFTCNTWTAEALDAAGLDADAPGVLFADQTMTRARTIAARRASGG